MQANFLIKWWEQKEISKKQNSENSTTKGNKLIGCWMLAVDDKSLPFRRNVYKRSEKYLCWLMHNNGSMCVCVSVCGCSGAIDWLTHWLNDCITDDNLHNYQLNQQLITVSCQQTSTWLSLLCCKQCVCVWHMQSYVNRVYYSLQTADNQPSSVRAQVLSTEKTYI